MEYCERFKGKKITMLGLGLLGRGVGDAEFLVKCGARVLVTDKKSAEELSISVERLRKYPNVQFVLGGHRFQDFEHCDMVIKSAGVPIDSPYIETARKNGIPILMSTALFVSLLPDGLTTFGVTGTRGKTTTAFILYEILKRFAEHGSGGKNGRKPRVFLGGNVQGVSTLALLPEIKSGDIVVMELDSWQLEGFGALKKSPDIAVFTTFLPDHLNYYRTRSDRSDQSAMRRYFGDKANIFQHQENKSILIAGEQAVPAIKKYAPKHTGRAVVAKAGDILKDWKLNIPGEHNRYNAACALAAARAYGIPDGLSREAIEGFGGVPGRLELVRELRGVPVYNDTTATTPDATIVALRTLGNTKQKNIILIAGGADKGLDMSALVREIPKYCKAVVFLPGNGTEIVKGQMSKVKCEEAKSLKDAVNQSMNIARQNDTVLFSPAFASFGMFKNEYDRGEQFMKLVDGL